MSQRCVLCAEIKDEYVKIPDPYRGVDVEEQRCFILSPSTGDQPQVDLSLLLLCLACERGMFGERLPGELWASDEVGSSSSSRVSHEINTQSQTYI